MGWTAVGDRISFGVGLDESIPQGLKPAFGVG